MERKLIFLDIDGTLVSAMAAPSPLAAEAVQRARVSRHKVFLCTGRNMPIIIDDNCKVFTLHAKTGNITGCPLMRILPSGILGSGCRMVLPWER